MMVSALPGPPDATRLQPVEIQAYAGGRGEEEPRTIACEGIVFEVREILRRWRQPEGVFFDVVVEPERQFRLFCKEPEMSWWLVA